MLFNQVSTFSSPFYFFFVYLYCFMPFFFSSPFSLNCVLFFLVLVPCQLLLATIPCEPADVPKSYGPAECARRVSIRYELRHLWTSTQHQLVPGSSTKRSWSKTSHNCSRYHWGMIRRKAADVANTTHKVDLRVRAFPSSVSEALDVTIWTGSW